MEQNLQRAFQREETSQILGAFVGPPALKAANTHVYLDLSHLEFIDGEDAQALADAIQESRGGTWCVEIEPNMSGPARRRLQSPAHQP